MFDIVFHIFIVFPLFSYVFLYVPAAIVIVAVVLVLENVQGYL